MWKPEHAYDFDVDAILAHDLDVLHIQYSNLFYNRRKLIDLMLALPRARRADVPRQGRRSPDLSLHACRPPLRAPGRRGDRATAADSAGHRRAAAGDQDVRAWEGSPSTSSPRSASDNGWRFEKSFGEGRWLEYEELYRWLRDCDAIVLWYEEDLTSGGSAAAPLAISTRRPVFVNDTEWFRDLPDETATLRKVRDPAELETALRALLADPYAEQRSWDLVAETLVADYRLR